MKQVVKIIFIAATAVLLPFSYGQSAENDEASGNLETKRISIIGNIGTEAAYSSTDYSDSSTEDEESSGMAATVELGFDASINKYVTGHAGVKWEDGETDALTLLDEGFFILGGNDSTHVYLKAGKMYVPFGKFETSMISDPLTLEIGETRETAVEIGLSYAGFNFSLYAFNGKSDLEGKDDKIDNYGASFNYVFSNDLLSLELGAGYINNIYDSNGLTDVMSASCEEAESAGYSTSLSEYEPGINAYATVKLYSFYLTGEYVAMTGDVEMNLSDITPGTLASLGLDNTEKENGFKAWDIEAGYTFNMLGMESTLCAGYQGVLNAGEEYPESRYIGAISIGILENTTTSLEYAYDIYENDDAANTITAKAEVTF